MGGVDRDGEAFLALDTGSPVVSAAVAVKGIIVAEKTVEIGRSSERLLGMVDDVLRRADRSLVQLSAILALRGPGSFTGLRVGLATALGLHQATGLRVGAISTMRVLAASIGKSDGTVVAAVDALRSEWFVQRFDSSSSLRPTTDIHRVPVGHLVDFAPATLVGFGVANLHLEPPDSGLELVEAGALAPTAASLAASWTEWKASDLLEPLYLRAPAVSVAR